LNTSVKRTAGGWREVPQLPGVLAYGASAEEAMAKAEVLALRVLAERLEHSESAPQSISYHLRCGMSNWPSAKAARVLSALLKIGWRPQTPIRLT